MNKDFYVINKMNSMILLVNKNDCEMEYANKFDVHKNGILHRAFSIILVKRINNKKYFLLQKRSNFKYHSPLLIANSCCSHELKNFDIKRSINKRLYEELHIKNIRLIFFEKFFYSYKFDNGFEENEIDYVFFGFINKKTRIIKNKKEVKTIIWKPLDKLLKSFSNNPNIYVPWFSYLLKCMLIIEENYE